MGREEVRTILQLVLIDETGDSYYRMRWPGRDVAAQAPDWRVLSLDSRARERFDWAEEADLLVVYQSMDLSLLPIIERRRNLGKKTVVEYNDNFYAPPPATPVVDQWRSPLIRQAYEQFIAAADVLTVTGTGLWELLNERFDKPVHILENHLPKEPEEFPSDWPQEGGEIRLGWAGSVGHMSDFLAVLPTIRRLMEEVPQLRLCLMGNEAIPGLLRLPQDRVSFSPWGTMEDYYRFWKPVHLGLAPLLDTPYNRCRSDIKAVEMSATGTAPLVSRLLPYEKFARETNAPMFSSFIELESLVKRYIAQPQAIRELAARCHRYASEQRVGLRHHERLDLYRQLMQGVAPSSFKWPSPPGYHEIQGVPEAVPRHIELIEGVKKAAGEAARNKVMKAIETAVAENPRHPEYLLALISLHGKREPEKVMPLLRRGLECFPSDLRFVLIEVQLCESQGDEALRRSWTEIVSSLERLGPSGRAFFFEEVGRLFLRHLRRFGCLLDIGERLSALYPDSGMLHFGLAESLEMAGEDEKALCHYRKVAELQGILERNRKEFASLTTKYVETWIAALEGRKES